MILNVWVKSSWRWAESHGEAMDLISDVLATLGQERQSGSSFSPGESAWFSLAERKFAKQGEELDNYVRVAVNRSTGHGALIWGSVSPNSSRPREFEGVWISDNPRPPDFDPHVVADPGYPTFHDPASTIPISLVMATLAEFYRLGTGDRPQNIEWVEGAVNGQRFDRPSIVERAADISISDEELARWRGDKS